VAEGSRCEKIVERCAAHTNMRCGLLHRRAGGRKRPSNLARYDGSPLRPAWPGRAISDMYENTRAEGFWLLAPRYAARHDRHLRDLGPVYGAHLLSAGAEGAERLIKKDLRIAWREAY